jgi:hypothetical protein
MATFDTMMLVVGELAVLCVFGCTAACAPIFLAFARASKAGDASARLAGMSRASCLPPVVTTAVQSGGRAADVGPPGRDRRNRGREASAVVIELRAWKHRKAAESASVRPARGPQIRNVWDRKTATVVGLRNRGRVT